jgi:hypothetical protein
VASTTGRNRSLARLHLVFGALSTLLVLVSLDLWVALSDSLVAGPPEELRWGKRVLMPNMTGHLAVAFALSQVAASLAIMPFVRPVVRWFDARWWAKEAPAVTEVGDVVGVVRSSLTVVVQAQKAALAPISRLAIEGDRDAGRDAEHHLAAARTDLQSLLHGAVRMISPAQGGREVGRVAFACLQLQRSLEALLDAAERLLDERIVASEGAVEMARLAASEADVIESARALLTDGLESLLGWLETQEPINADSSREREIKMNRLETGTRESFAAGAASLVPGDRTRGLELVGAYEAAGNQLYRVFETLHETYSPPSASLKLSALPGARTDR